MLYARISINLTWSMGYTPSGIHYDSSSAYTAVDLHHTIGVDFSQSAAAIVARHLHQPHTRSSYLVWCTAAARHLFSYRIISAFPHHNAFPLKSDPLCNFRYSHKPVLKIREGFLCGNVLDLDAEVDTVLNTICS